MHGLAPPPAFLPFWNSASTSAASIPPMTLPPPSTATPTPDGEDKAASSAWLRLPFGRNTEPPTVMASDNAAPPR
ncbi:Uncharacterised protein [Mycobacterium tuberculosis]|nr:Uncharacterised protein [Mycobacterium tuberculosis]